MRFAWAGVVVALLAGSAGAQEADAGVETEAADAGLELAVPDAGGEVAPPDAGSPVDEMTAIRSLLVGTDPVFVKSGLLAPPKGSFSVSLEGMGQFGCERFSARPDRRPVQVVADDQSGLHNACYRLGHVQLSGDFTVGKSLGAFFTFIPFAISQLDGGPVHRRATGVSDFTGGFRLQLFDDDLQGSLVVGVSVPIGRSSTNPPIGPGDFRADFMSYVSKQFQRLPILLGMGMGMRLRGWAEVNEVSPTTTVIGYSEELRFEMRAAYAFLLGKPWLPAILVGLTCDGRWSLDAGVEDGLGILNSPTGTTLYLGLEVVARLAYGFRVSVTGGQLVAGHSVPILTYFGAGVGLAR